MLLKPQRPKGFVIGRIATLLMVIGLTFILIKAKPVKAQELDSGADKSPKEESIRVTSGKRTKPMQGLVRGTRGSRDSRFYSGLNTDNYADVKSGGQSKDTHQNAKPFSRDPFQRGGKGPKDRPVAKKIQPRQPGHDNVIYSRLRDPAFFEPNFGPEKAESLAKQSEINATSKIIEDLYKIFQLSEDEERIYEIGRSRRVGSMLDFIKIIWEGIRWQDDESITKISKLLKDVENANKKLGIAVDMKGYILTVDRRDIFNIKINPMILDIQSVIVQDGNKFIPINNHVFERDSVVDLYGLLRKTNKYDFSPRPITLYFAVLNETNEVEELVEIDAILIDDVNDDDIFKIKISDVRVISHDNPLFSNIAEKFKDN